MVDLANKDVIHWPFRNVLDAFTDVPHVYALGLRDYRDKLLVFAVVDSDFDHAYPGCVFDIQRIPNGERVLDFASSPQILGRLRYRFDKVGFQYYLLQQITLELLDVWQDFFVSEKFSPVYFAELLKHCRKTFSPGQLCMLHSVKLCEQLPGSVNTKV